MNHDIDQLLNGLLTTPAQQNPTAPAKQPDQPVRRSAASEESLRRVEEIMRRVEQESTLRRAEQPGKKTYPKPQHEPVVVPPPVSHFSEEPSQDTAVRMRDRLDESALPMLDAEKKPNQIIPPKPKAEPPKKKRRKKKQQTISPMSEQEQSAQQDLPAPASKPARKIPHIVILDELPPDIPRDTTIADEIRRKRMEEQDDAAQEPVQEKRSVSEKVSLIREQMRRLQEEQALQEAPTEPEPPAEPAPVAVPEEPETPESIEEIAMEPEEEPEATPEEASEESLSLSERADLIRESIRQMHEELEAMPTPEELAAEAADEEAAPEELFADGTATEGKVPKARRFSFFRRKKSQEPELPDAPQESTEPAEDVLPEDEIAEAAEETEPVSEEPEEAPAEEPTDVEPDKEPTPEVQPEAAPVLRHLQMPEPEKPEKKGVFGLLSRKKKRVTEAPPETADPPAASEPEPATQEESDPLFDEVLLEADCTEAPEDIAAAEENFSVQDEIPEAEEPVPEPIPEEEPASPIAGEAPPPPEPVPSIDITLPGEDEREKKKNAFIAAIHAALDESAQELAEIKAEPIPEQSEIDVALGRPQFWKRYAYFIVGLLCAVFACVGVAACVVRGRELVLRFVSSSSLRTELEERIYPIAVVDLPPFGELAELQPEAALSAAVIDLLMYGDLSGFPCNFDIYSIPAEQVRRRAAAMFGDALTFTDTTLHAAGETFYYDEATGCYNVPASPMIFSYSPVIRKVTRNEDVYTVTVTYCIDTAQWQEKSDNFSGAGSKTMEITLEEHDGAYRITRVVNISDESEGM